LGHVSNGNTVGSSIRLIDVSLKEHIVDCNTISS
jgi:hypothetical protein